MFINPLYNDGPEINRRVYGGVPFAEARKGRTPHTEGVLLLHAVAQPSEPKSRRWRSRQQRQLGRRRKLREQNERLATTNAIAMAHAIDWAHFSRITLPHHLFGPSIWADHSNADDELDTNYPHQEGNLAGVD